MEIAFHFNMPPRQDKLTVTYGEANADDAERKFRVGFINTEEVPIGVHWSLLGWVDGNDEPRLRELQLEVDRGMVVRVERQDPDGKVTFFEIDTDNEWPGSAVGATSVLTSWNFED